MDECSIGMWSMLIHFLAAPSIHQTSDWTFSLRSESSILSSIRFDMFRGSLRGIIELQSRLSKLSFIPHQRCFTMEPGDSVKQYLTDEKRRQNSSVVGGIFRSLENSQWLFERTLTGQPADGNVRGEAQFILLKSDEILYKERGKLFLSSIGEPLNVTQKYLYVYENNDDERINVYFVQNQSERGSFFHTIDFQSHDELNSSWTAVGEHQCSEDHYSVSYLFLFNGLNLSQLEIKYTVKGPKKDYLSKTIFIRQ